MFNRVNNQRDYPVILEAISNSLKNYLLPFEEKINKVFKDKYYPTELEEIPIVKLNFKENISDSLDSIVNELEKYSVKYSLSFINSELKDSGVKKLISILLKHKIDCCELYLYYKGVTDDSCAMIAQLIAETNIRVLYFQDSLISLYTPSITDLGMKQILTSLSLNNTMIICKLHLDGVSEEQKNFMESLLENKRSFREAIISIINSQKNSVQTFDETKITKIELTPEDKELKEKMKTIIKYLHLYTESQDEAKLVKVQSMFRGFLAKKMAKAFKEKDIQSIKKYILTLVEKKEDKKVAILVAYLKQGKIHDAMQMVRGKELEVVYHSPEINRIILY